MITKACGIFGISKPLDDFALDPSLRADGKPSRPDGHHPYCKQCVRIKRKKDYDKNPDRFKLISKKWANKNPEKPRIYAKIGAAIRLGKIKKPDTCKMCGKKPDSIRKIVAHHPNGYTGKYIFDIKWLCIACHRKVHTKFS